LAASLPNLGFQSLRKGHAEIIGVRSLGGRNHFLIRGAGLARADVVGDGAGEEDLGEERREGGREGGREGRIRRSTYSFGFLGSMRRKEEWERSSRE